MFRSRLAIKIGLLIVIVLILGFGASTIVTIRRESDALIDQNKMAARRLTTAVVASIEGVLESIGEKTFKNVSQPIHVYRVIPPGIYEKIV